MRGLERRNFRVTVTLVALATFASAVTAAPGDARARRTAAEWSEDGLRRTTVPGLDLVYVRDGARLDGYAQVWLKSVDVAFRRDWSVPVRPGSRIPETDVSRIKTRLAAILREEAARELARGGYALADAPAPGVLEVGLSIVDLYVNAPDSVAPVRVDRYTLSAGEMTLQAELRDAPSGDLIARVLDRRVDRDRGRFEMTTVVDNAVAARTAARSWARILREQLDAARRIAPRT
jgi:Protein of unknown function (DUF3313)